MCDGSADADSHDRSGVTGSPSCTSTRTPSSPVNGATGYPISCTIGSLAATNYDFTFVAGTLTVTKATLTVTADDTSREYGSPTGSLSATISGFKNNQTPAPSGVTGNPSCTSTRTPSSPGNGATRHPI